MCLNMALCFSFSFLIGVKAAIQALLHLHSMPEKSYTKAGRDQNTDCNKYLWASWYWWAANDGGSGKVSDGHHHLFLLELQRDSGKAISCAWTHPRRSCCCCSWSGPSLYISSVASSVERRDKHMSRKKSHGKVENRPQTQGPEEKNMLPSEKWFYSSS